MKRSLSFQIAKYSLNEGKKFQGNRLFYLHLPIEIQTNVHMLKVSNNGSMMMYNMMNCQKQEFQNIFEKLMENDCLHEMTNKLELSNSHDICFINMNANEVGVFDRHGNPLENLPSSVMRGILRIKIIGVKVNKENEARPMMKVVQVAVLKDFSDDDNKTVSRVVVPQDQLETEDEDESECYV